MKVTLLKLLMASSLMLVSVPALYAKTLIEEAKSAGLAPLPKNQKEIDKFLKENNVKSSAFSEAKAELGKNSILIHDFQKVVLSLVILAII